MTILNITVKEFAIILIKFRRTDYRYTERKHFFYVISQAAWSDLPYFPFGA